MLVSVAFSSPARIQDDDLGLAKEVGVHLQGVEDLLGVEEAQLVDLQAVLVSVGRYHDRDGAVTVGILQCRDNFLQHLCSYNIPYV